MKQLALVVVALVLGLGFWLIRGSATGGEGGGLVPDETPGLVVERERTAPVLEDSDEADEPESVAAPVAPSRVEVASTQAGAARALVLSEPDPKGAEFEVVLEDGVTPLPAATLSYLGMQAAASGGAEEIMAGGGGLDAVLDKLGRHFRCDENGRVSIGGFEAVAIVRARGMLAGKRYLGMTKLQDSERRVVVVPEAGFVVSVVDTLGQPVADAEVQLVQERLRKDVAVRMALGTAFTDSGGRAFLGNVLSQLGDEAERVMGGSDKRTLVSLVGYFAERPEVEVDWREAEPKPIALVRPDVGRVVVTALDVAGDELGQGQVFLTPLGEDPIVNREPRANQLQARVSADAERLGRAVFENVEIGVPLSVHLVVDGQSVESQREGLKIPMGQASLEVELRARSAVLRLRGRALAEGGEPLVSQEVLFGRRGASSAETIQRITSVQTDSEGRFDLAAGWASVGSYSVFQPVVGGSLIAADFELPGGMSGMGGGKVDLGDLLLMGPALLVSGRVVDTDGVGVSVPLLLETRPLAGIGGNMMDWRQWTGVSAPDGSFELRGRSERERLILSVRSSEYLSSSEIEVGRGDTGVVLEVEMPGFFTYELPGVSAALVNALMLEVPTAEVMGGRSLGNVGSLRSGPLPSGMHSWRMLLGADPSAEVAHGELHVSSGEEVRLGAIVFDRPVYEYEVAVDVVGIPEDGYEARDLELYPESGPGKETGNPDWHVFVQPRIDGWFDVFSLDPISELEVTLGEWRTVAPLAEGENRVTLVAQ